MAKLTFTFLSMSLLGVVAACSPVQPVASSNFDGHYVGMRESNSKDDCGITDLQGKTSANITNGEITLPLFGQGSVLEGTVGQGGAVRASGMWQNRQGAYFPSMTTFTGQISNRDLEGEASNFKCRTIVHLRKAQTTLPLPLPPKPPPRKKPKAVKVK